MRNTTVGLFSQLPFHPDRWAVGVGFNNHIADLSAADAPPVTAADQALAAAGITRTSAWRPHPTRGAAGWLVADALDNLDHRPDPGDDTAMQQHSPTPTGPIPSSSAVDRLLDHADLLLAQRRYYDVVQLDPSLPGDEYRADMYCGPGPNGPTAVIWYRATSQDAAVSQARAWLAACEGPEDRFAEVWYRRGDVGELLTDVHLGA